MSASGRPLRFLGAVIGGWIGFRIMMLWPAPSAHSIVTVAKPPVLHPLVAPSRLAGARPATAFIADPPRRAPRPRPRLLRASRASAIEGGTGAPFPDRVVPSPGPIDDPPRPAPALIPAMPILPDRSAETAKRWSVSAWLLARAGTGLGASPLGGQLGGAQAGVRLAYALDRRQRLAAFARLATPLATRGREAAIGLDWRPTRLPIRLIAEQRIALEGSGGGPSIGLVAGAGPAAIGQGLRLEAYGQAGLIARAGLIGFADGAIRLDRPIARIGATSVAIGGGAWGGLQPGAARLDLGPSVALAIPIERRSIRLVVDWRERVAGAAQPGSGIALTLGTDF